MTTGSPESRTEDGRGNSNDRIRRHNLSVVLRLAHRSRGISRSALTRQTGLNRSTIAALVGELVERQLLIEVEPDANNQVGRPSPIAAPSPRAVVFAVNPEVDAITVGLVGLGGKVLGRIRTATEGVPTVSEAVAIAAESIAELRAEFEPQHTVQGIGVAIPGLVRARDGVVRLAPHLGWVDKPFSRELETATGLSVHAANDAHLGGIAENVFGAGRGVTDLVFLNGGASGIGSGIISGGRFVDGVEGYAGELGHTLVNSSGAACHCGAIGCLETEVQQRRLLSLAQLSNADSDELETALVGAKSADIRREVERQLDFLAVALRNAINTLNPEMIVLGGFLSPLYAAGKDHLDALIARPGLVAPRESVTIVRSELGVNRLMIGAAELAFEGILDDPASFAPVR
jgi:predicted NBD/HSP70 family sugar kinase